MGEHAEDPRFAAFYGLLVVEWRLGERLDAELEATAGVSLSRLELLLHLHWEDGRRRMSDLADALLLSRGGATRLVAKAEQDGLVAREIPPDDRRATYAVLTDAGARPPSAASRSTSTPSSACSRTTSPTRRPRCSCASGTASSRATAWPASRSSAAALPERPAGARRVARSDHVGGDPEQQHHGALLHRVGARRARHPERERECDDRPPRPGRARPAGRSRERVQQLGGDREDVAEHVDERAQQRERGEQRQRVAGRVDDDQERRERAVDRAARARAARASGARAAPGTGRRGPRRRPSRR